MLLVKRKMLILKKRMIEIIDPAVIEKIEIVEIVGIEIAEIGIEIVETVAIVKTVEIEKTVVIVKTVEIESLVLILDDMTKTETDPRIKNQEKPVETLELISKKFERKEMMIKMIRKKNIRILENHMNEDVVNMMKMISINLDIDVNVLIVNTIPNPNPNLLLLDPAVHLPLHPALPLQYPTQNLNEERAVNRKMIERRENTRSLEKPRVIAPNAEDLIPVIHKKTSRTKKKSNLIRPKIHPRKLKKRSTTKRPQIMAMNPTRMKVF